MWLEEVLIYRPITGIPPKASKRSCSFKKTTECRFADAVPFKATILQKEKTLGEENWIVPRASSRRQK